MRILGIDHIGIASADLGKHIEIFGDKLGLEIHDFEEKDPYGGLRTAFARVGDTEVELEAEPIDEVVDRALVPVDDSVDMVELAQLEPGGTSRHRSALAMISSP